MRKRVNGFRREGRGISRKRITVGTDPEFELVALNTGAVRRANEVVRGGSAPSDEIGVDGAGGPVELRPRPSASVATVVANIKRLMRRFTRQYPNYELGYHGAVHAIGGHVHVGVVGQRVGAELRRAHCEIADDFFGTPLRGLNGPARGYYGQLGDTREAHHGGLEYRVLAAGVFGDPELARIVMKGVKNILANLLSKNSITYQTPPTVANYRQVANLGVNEIQYLKTRAADLAREGRHEKRAIAKWGVAVNRRERPTRAARELGGARRSRFGITIEFQDEWAPNVRAAWRRAINAESFADTTYAPTGRALTVRLYGLRQDRGADCAAGIRGTQFRTIEHPSTRWDLVHRVMELGISYNVRTRLSPNPMANPVAEDMVRQIRSAIVRVR